MLGLVSEPVTFVSPHLRFSKGLQDTKGSPVMSRGQLQMAVASRTLQSAFTPHTPRQGLVQRAATQEGRSRGQSPWLRHSARHDVYGSPR